MKGFNSSSITLLAVLLSGAASSTLVQAAQTAGSAAARPAAAAPAPAAPAATAVKPPQATTPGIAKTQAEWRAALKALPKPKTTCARADYPRMQWRPVACIKPSEVLFRPKGPGGIRLNLVGGSNGDFAGQPLPFISSAEGSFDSITAGTTETGQYNHSGPQLADTYTLQLNSDFFTTPACAGSPDPSCKGFEQFVYENDSSPQAYIQYWLIQYDAACPAGGWTTVPLYGHTYCVQNGPGAASVPGGITTANLHKAVLTGWVAPGSDGVTIYNGTSAFNAPGNNVLSASGAWQQAEFNVFGDGGSGQANFSANTTITVRTTLHDTVASKAAPTCINESLTAETNNLTLVGTPAYGTQAHPAIIFNESNIPGSAASCASADGIGDTHLTTFGGLLYDFQASGDFVLAETAAPAFRVETRQVSGAPTWPNATVNKAIGTQMGKTRVAYCLSPSRLYVDGEARQVGEAPLVLPGGVQIERVGNVYLITDEEGDSVRVEDDGPYINVNVGLGRWPAKVRGVLANALNGDVHQIEARDGALLTNPFPFEQLYHHYADSWRVEPGQSLLKVCGEGKAEPGLPMKPFFARNLEPEQYARARTICRAAGVRGIALLDACTLDVTVLGTDSAAKVFAGMPAPKVNGNPGSVRTGGPGGPQGGAQTGAGKPGTVGKDNGDKGPGAAQERKGQ